MSNSFNFDEALKDLQAGKDLTGKDGILMPLIKQLTEAAIELLSNVVYGILKRRPVFDRQFA